MKRIKIKFKDFEIEAELYEELAPKTVRKILESLPIKGIVNRWGDEIYFETDVIVDEEENSKEVVELGDIAYWIPGRAICLFFGKTPISDDKIRPASAVNVIGKIINIEKYIDKLREVKDGEVVEVRSDAQ
ncbi:cyclophilin-like fold protein [Methanocaldococcus infernus]